MSKVGYRDQREVLLAQLALCWNSRMRAHHCGFVRTLEPLSAKLEGCNNHAIPGEKKEQMKPGEEESEKGEGGKEVEKEGNK